MAGFRPKETVFEAFGTGGGKDPGVLGQVDKGRTSNATRKTDSSAALAAMKNMRRQMRIARDKGSTLIVAGSANANAINGDVEQDKSVDVVAESLSGLLASKANDKVLLKLDISAPVEGKRHLSKAERKRLKKNQNQPSHQPMQHQETKKSKNLRGTDFRDEAFFIDDGFTAESSESARSRQIEAAMRAVGCFESERNSRGRSSNGGSDARYCRRRAG